MLRRNERIMVEKPLVSIIMPAYNAQFTIEESIFSVYRQTYTNWQLIIIDDRSTDNTGDIVKKLSGSESRVIFLSTEQNSGVAAARNLGITHAIGDYIAFLDSDDIWDKKKLELQLAFMQEHNSVISYTATSYKKTDNKLSSYILPAKEQTTYRNLLKQNIMSCSSVMVQTKVMPKFVLIKNIHEDYVAWLSILKQHKYAHGLNKPLLIYRLSANSKSANRIKSAVMNFNAYRAMNYSFFISFLLSFRYAYFSIYKRILIRKY